MNNNLSMRVRPSARLTDFIALIHSYSAVLKFQEQGISIAEIPLYMLGQEPRYEEPHEPVNLSLCGGPFPEDKRVRWPFYCDHLLEVSFRFGSQWWTFKFSPGRKYENREIPKDAPQLQFP
jgi:hypothetical protein